MEAPLLLTVTAAHFLHEPHYQIICHVNKIKATTAIKNHLLNNEFYFKKGEFAYERNVKKNRFDKHNDF